MFRHGGLECYKRTVVKGNVVLEELGPIHVHRPLDVLPGKMLYNIFPKYNADSLKLHRLID